MATKLDHAPVVTDASQPLTQSPVQELGLKERFYRYFQEEVTGTTKALKYRRKFPDKAKHSIARLSSEVSDASDYLPAYDQRTYSQV